MTVPPLRRALSAALPSVASPRVSRHARFFERLRAALYRPTAAAAGDGVAEAEAALDPLAIRQRLYGRGYIIPGDAAWLLELVAPLRLTASSALLDLAAGLGGPARTIAQALHSRVTGLEGDHAMAQQANAVSAALGAGHLVQIKPCNPETLELDEAQFDGALGREASYAVAEKERFLRVVAQSLRAGPIVLTDFVLDRAAGERDELGAWRAGLARPVALWTASQYADCFKSLGFALSRAEDISALYRRQLIAGWVRYLRTGDISGRPAAQIDAVLAEAEACRRTVAALESGALKYYRLEAVARSSSR
ncbi:MAG TPA: methyltransferase domain-containing protein [Stellaceae bacterium]